MSNRRRTGRSANPLYVPITTGLQFWASAEQIKGVADGGSLSCWADKSGNSNDVTQGTGSAQPTLNFNQQNGLPTIDFDGGDKLTMPSGLYPIPNGDNTVIIVAKQDATNAERLISMGTDDTLGFKVDYTAGGLAGFLNNEDSDDVTVGITETNFNIITAFKSGTTQSISVNGGTATTDTAGVSISTINAGEIGSTHPGTAGFFNGAIAEILIYNIALSTNAITLDEDYLSNKWGITLS